MSSMPVAGFTPQAPHKAADLIVRNAKITTGDPQRPTASAVAIADGTIIAIGNEYDVLKTTGQKTRVIDAQGRRVLPGLNDSHLHVIRGGLNYVLELRWDGVPTLAEAMRMLSEQVERTPKGQWVRVVGGFTKEQFAEKRLPTVAELNAVAPDTPVFILNLYQSAILNRAALKAAGYGKNTPNPPGGQIMKGHDGEPTGLLLAAPSAALLYSTLAKAPLLDAAEQRESTKHYLRELNRFGLTSAIDAAGGFQNFPDNYQTVMDLAETGELTLRIAYHLFPQVAGQELADLKRWTEMVKPGDGDAFLRMNGAGENLTWAAADFENFSEPRPDLAEGYEVEFEKAVRLMLENDWGFRLHATYDETIQRDLAVFEKLNAEGLFPGKGRWFFDHVETMSNESIDRVAKLGGSVSVQNRMSFQGEAFVGRYGAGKAETAPPVRAMLDRGLTVGAGTDATRVSSYNPWVALHWLITRRTLGGLQLSSPANRVDRETALQMYTRAGAELTGEDKVKGILKEGYYGDLAILSADYFTVAEEDIPHIESLLTVVDGRIVYAAGDYIGTAEPIEPVSPLWSPVAHHGGYYATPASSKAGVMQARNLAEAAADAREETAWRVAKTGVPARVHADDSFETHQH